MTRTHQPDLVTLDLQMPDVDGWEVLRTLKGDPEVKHIWSSRASRPTRAVVVCSIPWIC
ncbi:MAG TPA: response regulator [Gemmatimonadetes bacterium]|nr:response regulator [Gemmatimonadota bacterium]